MIGIICCILAYIGYHLFNSRRLKIKWEFIPAIFIICFSLCLFIFGLFQYMILGTYVYLGIGILLFIIEGLLTLLNKDRIQFNIKENIVTVTFIIFMLCYAYYLVHDGLLTHYDDFSHWGLAIKNLYIDQSLPNMNSVLHFIDYPPISALSIYSLLQWLPYDESSILFIRSIVLIALMLPLVSITKKEKPMLQWLNMLVVIATIGLFPRLLENLLVDYLLALTAADALLFLNAHKEQRIRNYFAFGIFIAFLVLLKDSGKYFAMFALMLLLWDPYLKLVIADKVKMIVFQIVIIFGVDRIWNNYIATHFTYELLDTQKFKPADVDSLQVPGLIDLTYLKAYISHGMFHSSTIILVIVFGLMILFFMTGGKIKKQRIELLSFLLVSAVFYVMYHFGLYVIYKSFMSSGEATQFAGYDRYMNTWVAFIILVIIQILANNEINSSKVRKGLVMIVIVVMLLTMTRLPEYMFGKVDTSLRDDIKERVSVFTQDDAHNNSIIYYDITIPEDPSGYTGYQLSYELMASKVRIWSNINPAARNELESLLADVEKIYVYTLDDKIKKFLGNYMNEEEVHSGSIVQWK